MSALQSLAHAPLFAHNPLRLPGGRRDSAVMLVISTAPDRGPCLLLTRRQSGLRQYAGDWCLPGGRLDAGDASLQACGWRELGEETGISSEVCGLLGELDDFYSGNGERVRPFVCTLRLADLQTSLRLQASEVLDYALVPLSRLQELVEDQAQRFPSRRQPAYLMAVEGADGQPGWLWGLTASILVHLRNVLHGQDAPICKGELFRQEVLEHAE